MRRHKQRLRIHAVLLDAASNREIWSERYDGVDEDLFTFQDQIASSISAAIDPRVREAEISRIRGRPTDSFDAYDCVLRGLSVQYNLNRRDLEIAGEMFQRAIELDPSYGQAHAHLAWWHNLRIGEGHSTNVGVDQQLADEFARRAVELDPGDAWSLAVCGHVQSFLRKRFRPALDLFAQALELNPSCATAWALSGLTLAYTGHGEEALARVQNALRLSPFDQLSFWFCTTNGIASIVAGQARRGSELAQQGAAPESALPRIGANADRGAGALGRARRGASARRRVHRKRAGLHGVGLRVVVPASATASRAGHGRVAAGGSSAVMW